MAGALALQGCVAAVIPLAAGGLMGERVASGPSGNSSPSQPAVTIPVEDVAATPEANSSISSGIVTVGAGSDNPALDAPPSARAEPVVVARAEPAPTPPAPEAPAPEQRIAAAATEAPAAVPTEAPMSATPREAVAVPSAPRTIPGASGINQFLSYANQQRIGSGELPASAMLSDRLSLEPERADCRAITPTVLIDLDPDDGLFDPESAARPPSGLGVGLARLRLSGVTIAWISGNAMEQADAVRLALARTGLDVHEEDRLLLLRNSDDRKQKLREELAEVSCLIAIAGDTRSDFDELYDYLLNPADARSLEPLIGEGWFLIPQPLLSERPNS